MPGEDFSCTWVGLPPGEPVSGKTYRADNWAYRNVPSLSHQSWDELMAIMGDGNYHILAMTTGFRWKRGQLVVSPDGMERLTAYVVSHGAGRDCEGHARAS